jgi:hypothetical protein
VNSEDLIDSKQAAKILGYCHGNIKKLVASNKLTPVKREGQRNNMYFKRSDITDFLTSGQVYNRKPPLNAVTIAEIVSRVKSGETMSSRLDGN